MGKPKIPQQKRRHYDGEKEIADKIGWNFDNSYSRLPESLFTKLNLTPVRSPKLIILNHPLAASLGLNGTALQGMMA